MEAGRSASCVPTHPLLFKSLTEHAACIRRRSRKRALTAVHAASRGGASGPHTAAIVHNPWTTHGVHSCMHTKTARGRAGRSPAGHWGTRPIEEHRWIDRSIILGMHLSRASCYVHTFTYRTSNDTAVILQICKRVIINIVKGAVVYIVCPTASTDPQDRSGKVYVHSICRDRTAPAACKFDACD